MTTIRNAAFATALLISGAAWQPAAAMPAVDLSGLAAQTSHVARSDFAFGGELAQARLDRLDSETAQAAAAAYFDFDAVITFGALAVIGAGLAAFFAMAAAGRRAQERDREPAWRETVFSAVQADLATFTESYRRAA